MMFHGTVSAPPDGHASPVWDSCRTWVSKIAGGQASSSALKHTAPKAAALVALAAACVSLCFALSSWRKRVSETTLAIMAGVRMRWFWWLPISLAAPVRPIFHTRTALTAPSGLTLTFTIVEMATPSVHPSAIAAATAAVPQSVRSVVYRKCSWPSAEFVILSL
jgi:hypothetical protein